MLNTPFILNPNNKANCDDEVTQSFLSSFNRLLQENMQLYSDSVVEVHLYIYEIKTREMLVDRSKPQPFPTFDVKNVFTNNKKQFIQNKKKTEL